MQGLWKSGGASARVFVTQPIAASALARLRALAAVDVNPDSTVNGPPFQIHVVRIEITLAFCPAAIQRLPQASVT